MQAKFLHLERPQPVAI